jgi:Tetratricopeptide repeat
VTAAGSLLVAVVLAGEPRTCACPCSQPAASEIGRPGGGSAAVVVRPREEAFAKNRLGRDLYRQRRWDEARQAYRDALALDPTFLGPRLNLACAFVQEGKFVEAVAELDALLRAGYAPWAREIAEAADLAPLRIRQEYRRLRALVESAGPVWGAPILGQSLLFVARTAPPVNLPPEDALVDGTLVLRLNQEIFAYLPATGTYRQVTAESGAVLAFARSRDGRSVAYVRGGKMVRSPGAPARLRGLTLRRLELGTMSLGPAVPLPGDLEVVDLAPAADGSFAVRVVSRGGVSESLGFDGGGLQPVVPAVALAPGTVRLDASGVAAQPRLAVELPGCRFSVHDKRPPGSDPAVEVRAGGRIFTLAHPHGGGLAGLPFPQTRTLRGK